MISKRKKNIYEINNACMKSIYNRKRRKKSNDGDNDEDNNNSLAREIVQTLVDITN
jgi:hypothetical protein